MLISANKGFTLVELMISLVLGLLITAAIFQVYWINVKTRTVQQSSSELQDASVFGLQTLEQHIRMANLGNPTSAINNKTLNGGIVLTGFNIGVTAEKEKEVDDKKVTVVEDDYKNTGYLTRSNGDAKAGTNGWSGLSNIKDIESDQITIQYHNITGTRLFDCEGSEVANGELVIERYYIRESSHGDETVLACDAGRLNRDPTSGNAIGVQTFTPATNVKNFGQTGQEVIVGVDQFKVLLGVQSTSGASTGSLHYLTSADYLDDTKTPATGTPAEKPAIVAVKLGLIVHGSTPVMASSDQTSLNLFGQSNKINDTDGRAKKARTTYETTILLRNARVMAVSALPTT